jgi:hypothetical protein
LIACPYALYERVKKELMLVDAVIDGTDFGAEITLEALIVKGGAEGLNKKLLDISSGTVEALVVSEEYRAVKIDAAGV